MRYFFDTYAIIEIIKETPSYEKYRDEEIITSVLNIGELYYALLRDFGERTANEWYGKLKNTALGISSDDVVEAMRFRFGQQQKKLSFVDCVGYITALANGLVFLTGDREFEGLPKVEFVRK